MSLVAAFVKAHGGTVMNKENPNHDEKGEFASGSWESGNATKTDKGSITTYHGQNSQGHVTVDHNKEVDRVTITHVKGGKQQSKTALPKSNAKTYLSNKFGIEHKF